MELLKETETVINYAHELVHNKTGKIIAQVGYYSPTEIPDRIEEIQEQVANEGNTCTHNVYARTTIITIKKIA